MNTLLPFPAKDTFTPEQALMSALQFTLQDVVVIGYDTNGELFIRSSRMDRKDALWLAEMFRDYLLTGGI